MAKYEFKIRPGSLYFYDIFVAGTTKKIPGTLREDRDCYRIELVTVRDPQADVIGRYQSVILEGRTLEEVDKLIDRHLNGAV